jgi:hypothetical protein
MNTTNTSEQQPQRGARSFAFEDLPLDDQGRRIEPESWGPIYSKPVKPTHLRVYDPPTNAPSGQKGPIVDDAKLRAKIKAEFVARCHAERKGWAEGRLTIDRPGFSGNIVAAYEQAMAAKRARLAARKPHYVLRAGEWRQAS